MRKKKNKMITIDPERGLEFSTEEELYQHFYKEIQLLEKEYGTLQIQGDIPEEDHEKYEAHLSETLEKPDEIWFDDQTLPGQELSIFLKEFEDSQQNAVFHVALTYTVKGLPSFVYLHFPTKRLELVEKYQRGEITYDRILEEAPKGAIEGDALLEGDELALGFYQAMLKVRSRSDFEESEFRNFAHLRESSIEEADEIWRKNDPFGNVIVNFVKEHSLEDESSLYYIVVTMEDPMSNSHALLFSFPTKDKTLYSRYRQGENLQAEDVSQESSH